VLSGLIGTLLAKGLDGLEAACLGTAAHVLAAEAAAGSMGVDHVMAGDVIDALPRGLTLR
jgi:NAD(P)H-hydrate repair Nnr-like enzyme with NAD(P)H-hydrate dehydratase domain